MARPAAALRFAGFGAWTGEGWACGAEIELSQPRGATGNQTKCHVVSWMGSWNRRRTVEGEAKGIWMKSGLQLMVMCLCPFILWTHVSSSVRG